MSPPDNIAGESRDQVIEAHQMENVTITQEKVNVMGTGAFGAPLLSKKAVSSKFNCSEASPSNLSGNCIVSSLGVELTAVKVKTECPEDVLDGHDLVPLKERRRALLARYHSAFTDLSYHYIFVDFGDI